MDVREYQYRDTTIVNTAMYGVHNQIHEVLEVGDSMVFELAMFEDTWDVNPEKTTAVAD